MKYGIDPWNEIERRCFKMLKKDSDQRSKNEFDL